MGFGIGRRNPTRLAHPTKPDWQIEIGKRAPNGFVTVKAYRDDTPAALPLVTASGREMVDTMTRLDEAIDRWEADQ